jgi:NAD(P)-dependent dehydrogenase (short-subunit alcohol dehydrogenase family)
MTEKVAILTAASRGIGEACAELLRNNGYNIGILATSEKGQEVADRLDGIFVQGSVDRQCDLEELVSRTTAKWGRIDSIVYGTGHAPWSSGSDLAYNAEAEYPLLDIPDEDWSKSFGILFLGLMQLSRAALPYLKVRGGSIAVISSFSAVEPRLNFPASSAIRPAVQSLVKLMADRFGRDGIRINAVLPGFLENWPASQKVIETIPLGRTGKLKEVAAAVEFLLSPSAGYITGQSLVVDGGVNRSF